MNRTLLSRIAEQVSSGRSVSRTPSGQFGKKTFMDGNRKIVAIEQNPKTGSEWARLAQNGHKVVQFKDVDTNTYVAVSVDGKVKEY